MRYIAAVFIIFFTMACASKSSIGTVCIFDEDCPPALFCDETKDSGTCQERATCDEAEGIFCPEGWECNTGNGLCKRASSSQADADKQLPGKIDTGTPSDADKAVTDDLESDLLETDSSMSDNVDAIITDTADTISDSDSPAIDANTSDANDTAPDTDTICVNECGTAGSKVCDGTTKYRTCTLVNGCLKYDAGTLCGSQTTCQGTGECVCVPNCNGKVCGDNGCGGSCGTCPLKTGACISGTEIEFFAEATCSALGQCNYSAVNKSCSLFCGDGSKNNYANEPTCYGINPLGTLDGANETGVNGWACDPDTPYKIDIHLYFDSQPGDISPMVRVTKAENGSESAVDVQCGGGTGYRFAYTLTAADKTELGSGLHTVKAFAINNDKNGNNPEISGSPKSFTLP